MPEPLFDDEPVVLMPTEIPAATATVEPPEIAHLKPFAPNPDITQLSIVQLDQTGALSRRRDLLELRDVLEDACKEMERAGEAWYSAAMEFRAHVEQATKGTGLAAVVGEDGYQLLNTMAKEQKAAMVAFDVVVLLQCAVCLEVRRKAEAAR